MDHDPTVAANAVLTHMLAFLPSDAGGGAAALEQALPVQDQRFRAVGKCHGNQEEADAEAGPPDPVESAGRQQSSCAVSHRADSTGQDQIVKEKTGWFHREAPTIHRSLRL